MSRRVVVALGLIALGLALSSPRASAHALLASSEPAAGATLGSSPSEVVLHFTEPPDPGLSVVHVVDQAGHSLDQGGTKLGSDPNTLRAAVASLSNGTYTVTWRTTSAVDGHTTAGSYAFGVGQPPATDATATVSAEGSSPAPSVLGVAGRALLYAGLASLVGGAAIVIALRLTEVGSWAVTPTFIGWAAATVGAIVLGVDELNSSGASLRQFLSSSPGRHWEQLLAVVSVAAFAVAAFVVRRRRSALFVVGALALVGMLARADAGHAAGSSAAWFTVGTQWLHFAAVGAWVGALPWFVVLLRRTPPDERRALARRFSVLATVGIGVVGVTGTLRAINEVSQWDQLWHNSFGRTLLVKVGLVATIAAVGTINHFVLTRRLPEGSTRLSRAVRVEIGVGAVVVVLTGLLTGLAPASSVAAATPRTPHVKPVVVEGHDFATTTRVRLEVTPGLLGPNRFNATITDYDTNQPVDATAAKLRFALASRPDLGNTSLDLTAAGPGRWEGSSATMAIAGVWDVTAVVSDAKGGLEVPLRVRLGVSGLVISTVANPGQSTIYDMREPDGTHIQAYVDPGKAGQNTVHVTMFDASGNELPVDTVDAAAFGPGGGSLALFPQRFDPGHFVIPATLTPGTWTYAVTVGVSDRSYTAIFDDPVEGQ